MKRWIPGVIILAGILATVGFVTSNTETSLASDHVNGTGDIEESQSDGQVTEGVAFIGIALAPVSEDSGATGGALIISVVDGGAADGLLQEKDIIMAVDGVAVDSPRDVVEMVHALLPDDVVTFAVYRDGASLDIEVTAGERETTTLAFGNLTIPQLMPHPVPHKMPSSISPARMAS
jgi:S1-C subfamily serine protease